ncbi:4-alpha-glucanotransferase [uncultured Paracoccus sp.]|uniref:4-alpha-glucanotransferase n=1 Tax=uncultured Paracoccus sp. TaxID=189685 RepID=UPI00262B1E03|nr:4-alpha-glucanotransferase [uncultured Paracoccus sp.]
MSTALDRLARHHGLTLSYTDYFTGDTRPVPDTTKRLILQSLGVDLEGKLGGDPPPRRMEVPAHARCWLPETLLETPGWGLFCQLYELRSARNWGIGDFADLAELARIAGAQGADFLGINPVHALFLADPDRRSPFSPSNRRFLNPLYIAPDLVGAELPASMDSLHAGELVDYPAVAAAKLPALRAVFDRDPQDEAVDAFDRRCGTALRLHALFEALSARMVARGLGAGWRDWPKELRDPEAAAASDLAREIAPDIRFHMWLQMIARRQLDAAAQAARDAGMRIGLYLDLAVGEAPDGSAIWSGAAATLSGLTVGAPPDMYAEQGQDWGLAAPSPTALKDTDFASFREMTAAQLRGAGALRIDHAMALWQLYLVPEGATPAEGAHLRYPFADFLSRLAGLSREYRAIIIGEDLGFVPRGFQRAMAEANILSYRILIFEQTARGFRSPARYPRKALACLSTHDLPVFASWWKGEDVARRRAFGQLDAGNSDCDALRRGEERAAMLRAFRRAGTLEAPVPADAPELPPQVLDAAHLFLARSPACLVGVRLADLTGPEVPTNVPGTSDEYPNWRPKSPVPVEDIAVHPVFAATAALMRRERPRAKNGS